MNKIGLVANMCFVDLNLECQVWYLGMFQTDFSKNRVLICARFGECDEYFVRIEIYDKPAENHQ
jgi:hypothetical protein